VRAALACIAFAAGLAVLGGAATAAGVEPTVLPRPDFPGPVATTPPSGPTRLVLVSSRPHAPGLSPEGPAPPSWLPKLVQGHDLLTSFRQGNRLFALYGTDGASASILVAANRRAQRVSYAFDFGSFLRPTRIARGAEDLVAEEVAWAREAGGILYVESTHLTYATSSGGRNAYITAIDLTRKKVVWRSAALVANARTFVVAGDDLVTGYGFTKEPDFLYLLDRKTGAVRDRLRLPSAAETITRRGNRIFVRTYDHDVVAELRPR
jgi:hypothetical protein